MRPGDAFVVFLLSVVLVGWLYFWLRKWALTPRREIEEEWTIEPDDEIIVTEAVELLEQSGYTVLTGKRKIPVEIKVDDTISLKSRLFVDHFAERDGDIYVVKVARETHPVELTGDGIRDDLLPYQLLYPEAGGVLFVDTDRQLVTKIEFVIDDDQ